MVKEVRGFIFFVWIVAQTKEPASHLNEKGWSIMNVNQIVDGIVDYKNINFWNHLAIYL